MARYNCAFMFDPDFSSQLVRFAQDNFSDIAEGYCLSDEALVHATVVQFSCDEEKKVKALADEVSRLSSKHLKFSTDGFSVRFGAGKHKDYLWLELGLNRTKDLHEFHRDVIWLCKSYDIEPTSVVGDLYRPHITFCRVPKGAVIPSLDIPADFMGECKGAVRLVFGHSTDNGVLLSESV